MTARHSTLFTLESGDSGLGFYTTQRDAAKDLAEQAAAVLLEVMQDPLLEARYLQGVLPLVADVRMGRSWADCH
jgi:hypothetical protein